MPASRLQTVHTRYHLCLDVTAIPIVNRNTVSVIIVIIMAIHKTEE